jgi:DNA-binding SARP family transcriptional activator
MEFRILGPLEVLENGRQIELGGAKQRALLAILLLHANEVVSTDRLIDALWEDEAPANGRKTLQVYVSQLRKALGKGRVETRPPGYVLRVEGDELDLARFRQLVEAGEHRQALALWRGTALADFAYQRFAQAEITVLDELRLACLENRIETDLAAGRQAAVVGELEALVEAHPLRERLREQLMLALYRSGRQAEALDAYQDARQALVEELGIEPGRSLRALQKSILAQDRTLDLDRGVEPDPPHAVHEDPAPASTTEPGRPRAERKTITAIHVRVAATSWTGDQLDPEVLGRVLTRAFEEVTAVVEAHEGTIDAISGDSVTGVFGLPVVHEDDPLRAATAGEQIQARLVRLAEELQEAGARLHGRIGVSTGEVVTGGAPGTRLGATGEPLTKAVRLAQEAGPRETVLDEATRRAVSARRNGGRFASPMVGRARERRRLHDAFEQAAGDRSCQLFTVLGAAGVGKSRLVQEFLDDLVGRALVARGRCLPYGEGITFWPVLEAIKDVAGLDDAETAEDAKLRLAALLGDGADAEAVAQRMIEVLGLTETAAGVEEGFQAVRAFFELLAVQGPLVVVFDDVHWGEETFLDLVEHLADWSRGAPILLLCMARPELLDARPSWGGGKLNSTSVLLEPLSDAECTELVANLVGEATLAEEVQDRIASAAEGNPLFVEEVLSMLIDDGILVRKGERWAAAGDLTAFPVPPTIQALLAARLDQLSAEERAVVEPAAVEGKVFHESSVAWLAAPGAPVGSALASLVRKELIRPERPVFAGERAFRFRHLMIRDAAYDAVPKGERAALHELHVAWLEQKTGEHSFEFDEIVGYHLEQAVRYRTELAQVDEKSRELGRRAAERLGAAGRRAFARSDAPAGVNLVSRAVALLPPDDPLRVALVPNVRAVQSASDTADLGWADRVLTEAVEAAATTGDRSLAAHALVQRGLLRLFTAPDVTLPEIVQTAEQAIDAFEDLGDDLGLARAWRLVAQAQYLARNAAGSADAAEQALVHARRAGDRFEEVEVVEWLLVALLFGPCPATDGSERCRQLQDEVAGHPALEAMVAVTRAGFEAARGRAHEARGLLTQAQQAMDQYGEVIAFVLFEGASMHMLFGEAAEAEADAQLGYDTLRAMGGTGHFGALALRLAQAMYGKGRYDDADRLLDEAARVSRANDVWDQTHWRSERAKILARRGDFEAAEELAREAVAFAAASDFLSARADASMDLGEVLLLVGRPDESASAIGDAIAVHEQKGNLQAAGTARLLLESLRPEHGTEREGRA